MTSISTIFVVTEAHDGAVSVILGDLLNGEIEIFVAGGGDFVFAGFFCGFSGHNFQSLSKAATPYSPSGETSEI